MVEEGVPRDGGGDIDEARDEDVEPTLLVDPEWTRPGTASADGGETEREGRCWRCW